MLMIYNYFRLVYDGPSLCEKELYNVLSRKSLLFVALSGFGSRLISKLSESFFLLMDKVCLLDAK